MGNNKFFNGQLENLMFSMAITHCYTFLISNSKFFNGQVKKYSLCMVITPFLINFHNLKN